MKKKPSSIQILRLLLGFLAAVAVPAPAAQDSGPVSHWAFDEGSGRTALDTAANLKDAIEGLFKYRKGVSGAGLTFDGYTTHVIRKGNAAPRLGDAFSMDAWIAMAALPWNWCPILSREANGLAGYSFGIGPRGEFGLKVSVRGEWRECLSQVRIPVGKWAHVAAVFDAATGIRLFLDGQEAGALSFQGKAVHAGRVDLLIGMNPEKRKSSHIVGDGAGTVEGWHAFDGIMDEIRIFNRALSPGELKKAYDALTPLPPPELAARRLPSGPPGPGRFGAYYTKLKYDESWDALWPVGPAADVVVEFDGSPIRVVFWRGTRYGPAWVMENGQWIVDQSMETWNDAEGCYEHMEDPRCLYSHVRILESNEARVVVHWRYAPVSSRDHFSGFDDLSGWGLWVDEYYYFYPDLKAVRKITWPSRLLPDGTPSQIQETIPLTQPGQNTGDILHSEAITILNLKGERQAYSWPGEMSDPNMQKNLRPVNPNIQVVNLKSKAKPFIIFEPGCRMRVYVGRVRSEVAAFSAYNHFPVSLYPSDGRFAVSSDKVASFSISNTSPPRHPGSDSTTWAAWIYGVTEDASGKDVAAIGRSWAAAPELAVRGAGVLSEGYDLSQRAYLVRVREPGKPAPIEGELRASAESPAANVAFVVKDWGDRSATLKLDGKAAVRGRDFRIGSVRTPEGFDLIVWIKIEAVRPVKFRLSPQ